MLDRYTYPTTISHTAIDTLFPIAALGMALVIFIVLAHFYDEIRARFNTDRRPGSPGPASGRGAGTHQPASTSTPIEDRYMNEFFTITMLHTSASTDFTTWETCRIWQLDRDTDGSVYLKTELRACLRLYNDAMKLSTTLISYTIHHGPRLVADSTGYIADLPACAKPATRPDVTHHQG